MNIAFVLHLYQPPTQSESILKEVIAESYLPLLKLLKSKSNANFTLNVPLSTLELFDKYNHPEILQLIKELYESDRVELTGSGAYHPLLTKIPEKYAYKQIILNEYGLGYYFGSHQGFEGESSILIKNLKGFFPPELAVSKDVINIINNLNYEWVIVDTPAINNNTETCTYRLNDVNTILVTRNTTLSNLISFKRDSLIEDIVSYIMNIDGNIDNIVIATDAETFGHHNKEGISFLDLLIDKLLQINVNITTVSEIVSNSPVSTAESINESTWAVKDKEDLGSKYRYWDSDGNKIHTLQWQLQKDVFKLDNISYDETFIEGLENIPLWKADAVLTISNDVLRRQVMLEILLLKSMHSDQFWWASNEIIYDKQLYSPYMISQALLIYNTIVDNINDDKLRNNFNSIKDQINQILNTETTI